MKPIPIPVVAGTARPRKPRIAAGQALLHAIASHLEQLLKTGATARIDLRREPLQPDDRALLDRVLGQGGIDATLEALGRTRIRETSVPGVWRVTHYDNASEVVAEFIEVTELPDLLRAHRDDVSSGLERLKGQLGNLPSHRVHPTHRAGQRPPSNTR